MEDDIVQYKNQIENNNNVLYNLYSQVDIDKDNVNN